MEVVTCDDDLPAGAAITEILNRYGDLFPRLGTVEIYDYEPTSLGLVSYADYALVRPGKWDIAIRRAREPRPGKIVRYLSTPGTGDDDAAVHG